MTTRVDLQEFLGAYLAEVEEHLAMARARLVVADEAARQKPPARTPREVRDAFRAVHTIKGLSAMVGIEPVVAVSHRMETVLRAADRAGVASPQSIELLLQGLDTVERFVAELGRGGKATASIPPGLLEALAALEPDEGDDERPPARASLDPALSAKLAPFERELLAEGARKGKLAVRADFCPSPEKAKRGLTITKVRETIATIAEIVKVLPISDPVLPGGGGAGLRFALLLLIDPGTAAQIADIVEVSPNDVVLLGFEAPQAVPALPSASASAPAAAPRNASPASAAGEEGLPAGDIDFDEPSDQPLRRNLVRVDVARIDDAMEKLAALIVTRSRLARAVTTLTAGGAPTADLVAVTQDNARQLRDLRAALLRVRMVPIGEVLERLPLVVRGLRRSTGKNVHLELEGASEELDKAISERLFPALLHLVRNAVDHGLETPDERARTDKPAEGRVRVSCSSRSNRQLVIAIDDDGRGIDRAAVAKSAGISARTLDDRELLDLLCRPGLSTKSEVTTTSGRGMGMDIVRRVIDELGGELAVTSELGRGTRFTLTVPLTLTIVDAFVFRCAGERFVVPVTAVEEIVELDARVLQRPASIGGSGGSLFERRGEAVTLFALAHVLELTPPGDAPSSDSIALIVRRGGDAVAFAVERVIGQQETVVRPLRDPLVQAPGVAGTTDLGDGRATLVLDLGALATARERAA